MEFIKNCKNLFKKNILVVISIIVIIFYGQFYSRWGIEADDYGVIYSGSLTNISDFFGLFEFKDFASSSWSSNCKNREQSFFSVFYRPLTRLAFSLQLPLFKDSPVGYYLVIVLLMVLISILFYILLLKYLNDLGLAFIGTMFFSFHISLATWFGRISTQNYYVAMLFLLLTLFSFVKKQYLFSYFFYFIALFSFEGPLFFPIFISLLFLIKKLLKDSFDCDIGSDFRHLLKSSVFWIINIVFLGLRFLFFKFDGKTSGFWNLILSIKSHIYASVATFLFEFLNITIASGNFYLKFSLAFLILFTVFLLFLKSRNKKEIFYFLIMFLLAAWPVFIKSYRSRYSFFALPFFVFFIFSILKNFIPKYKKIVYLFFIVLISYNIYWLNMVLEWRSKINYNHYLSYQELLKFKNIIRNRNLGFVGLPSAFCSNLAQFLWIHNINNNYNINVDGNSMTINATGESELLIRPVNGGFLFGLSKTNKGSFFYETKVFKLSMGNFVDITEDQNYIYRECFFDEKYLNQDMVFVTWDYKKNKFKILNEKPL